MRFTLSTPELFKTCDCTHFQMELKPDKVQFLIVGSGGHEWVFDVVGADIDEVFTHFCWIGNVPETLTMVQTSVGIELYEHWADAENPDLWFQFDGVEVRR